MKKKFLITATAVALTFAMATSAIAAPTARDNGNVDKSAGAATSTAVNSNDASALAKAAAADTYVENGNFDGAWNSTDFKMSGNAQKVMNFILTPEKMTEKIGLRAYTASGSDTSGGFASNYVANIYTDLELDTAKKAWNGNYNDYEAPLTADTNHTIDEVMVKATGIIDGNDGSVEVLGEFLSGIAFEGFGKNAGKQVYLTGDEGWGVFAVAMREIVPLSMDDYIASGYEGNADDVLDVEKDGYGVVGEAPYNDISEITDPELRARAEAFQELKSMIVTNRVHSEGVNDTNVTSASELYAQSKIAFPSDITEEAFRATADHFGAIYTRRYTVNVGSDKVNDVMDGNVNGQNSDFVNKLVESGIYHYENATIQDLRDAFGDKIELTTTKDGEKTWGFTLELYVRYDNAATK